MWKDWVVLLTWLLIKSKHDINKYNLKKKNQYAFPQTKPPKHTATQWAELKLMQL